MAKYLQDIRLSGGTVSIGTLTSSNINNLFEVNGTSSFIGGVNISGSNVSKNTLNYQITDSAADTLFRVYNDGHAIHNMIVDSGSGFDWNYALTVLATNNEPGAYMGGLSVQVSGSNAFGGFFSNTLGYNVELSRPDMAGFFGKSGKEAFLGTNTWAATFNQYQPGGKIYIGADTYGVLIYGASTSSSTIALDVRDTLNQALFRVRDDGNVGIGTDIPGNKLEVAGTVSTTGFRMTNGASPGYILQSDASGNATWVLPTDNTGVTGSGTTNYIPRWTTTDTLSSTSSIYDNGTNVGMGTTTPTEQLHVVGNFRYVDGNQATGYVLTSDTNGVATWQTAGADQQLGTTDQTLTANRIVTQTGFTLDFQATDTNRAVNLLIDPTGDGMIRINANDTTGGSELNHNLDFSSQNGLQLSMSGAGYGDSDSSLNFNGLNLGITTQDTVTGEKTNFNFAQAGGTWNYTDAGVNENWIALGGVMTIKDGINGQGILYDADYSGGFVARSLVDKGYVDGLAGTSLSGLGTDDRIARWNGSNTIQDSDWFINDSGVLYPNTDGQNIGITGSNRIGTIFMSSILDYSSDGSGLLLQESGVTRMIIATGGNVGIGVTEPTEKLTIDGNINFLTGTNRSIVVDDVTSGNGYGLTIQGGSSTAAGVTGGTIYIKAGSATNLSTGGTIYMDGGGGQSSGSTGHILLQTISNGRVGIGYGLTSPIETLHVYDGRIKIEKPLSPANNTGLVLYNPIGSGANDFRIDFTTTDTGGTEYPVARIRGYNYDHSGTDVVSGELALSVSNGVSDPVDALTINKYGNTKTTGQSYTIRTDNPGNGTLAVNLTAKEQVIMAQAIGSRGVSTINYYLPDVITDGIIDGHVITFKTLNIVSGSIDIQSDLGILLDGSQTAATASILLTPWRSRSFIYNNTFGYYLEVTTGPDDIHNYKVATVTSQTLEQSAYYVRIPDPTGGAFTYSLPEFPCPSGKEIQFVTTALTGGSTVSVAASSGGTMKMLGSGFTVTDITLSAQSSYRFILDGGIWYQV